MARFASVLLLALFAIALLSPSLSTTSHALSVHAAEAAAPDDDIPAGDLDDPDADFDEDDVPMDDDDDDIDVGDDDDADDDEYPDEDDEEDDEDDAEAEAADPDQPAVLDPPGEENVSAYSAPDAPGALFFDSFQAGLSQWTHSKEADYNGQFAIGQGAKPVFRGDRALIIPEKARKYGLSAKISGLDDMSEKALVVQYEVKLEQGMTCGGAYVKLVDTDFEPEHLKGDTSYSVMFGPDKCGSTDKVHFIFQSLNPITGKRTEHHLKSPPSVANSFDKKTHLYTLVVKEDATFEVRIDGETKSSGSLTDKFEPALQPEKQIDDPEDKKPKEWVDKQKIPDPEATKPDDWDEDAPAQIVDEDATKPDKWLDDEPKQIADPEAEKPDGWDDAEDGAWDAPLIDNPKCEAVGCGEWTKPMKKNPEFKGKWKAPMIDNPEYIGEWKPKKIDNPEYYEVSATKLLGIGGVAFEIWTMDQGVLFDNIWVGSDIGAAEKYAKETFEKKQAAEAEKEEEDKAEADKTSKEGKKKGKKGGAGLGPVMEKVMDVVDRLERLLEPVEAYVQKMGGEKYLDRMIDLGIQKPMLVVVLVPLALSLAMLAVLGGGKKQSGGEEESTATRATGEEDAKKTDAVTQDDVQGEEAAENVGKAGGEDAEEEVDGVRQRATGGGDE